MLRTKKDRLWIELTMNWLGIGSCRVKLYLSDRDLCMDTWQRLFRFFGQPDIEASCFICVHPIPIDRMPMLASYTTHVFVNISYRSQDSSGEGPLFHFGPHSDLGWVIWNCCGSGETLALLASGTPGVFNAFFPTGN